MKGYFMSGEASDVSCFWFLSEMMKVSCSRNSHHDVKTIILKL